MTANNHLPFPMFIRKNCTTPTVATPTFTFKVSEARIIKITFAEVDTPIALHGMECMKKAEMILILSLMCIIMP